MILRRSWAAEVDAFESIQRILARVIGLEPGTIGKRSLDLMLRRRLAAVGDPDYVAYLRRLQGSPSELRHLIEAALVPESWFFREPAAFDLLKKIAVAHRDRYGRERALQLLSLGCSTGEEPYSIAMTLLDAGLKPAEFRIRGMDINRPALALARAGRYRAGSFRGDDLRFRSRWFTECEDGAYQLDPSVLSSVELTLGNILHPMPDRSVSGLREPRFDVVFFRNVLIYLSAEARGQVMARLRRLLAPDGLIFAGHAEAGLFRAAGFQRNEVPRTFAFTHGSAAEAPAGRATPPALADTHAGKSAADRNRPAKPSRRSSTSPRRMPKRLDDGSAPTPGADRGELASIRALADRGELNAAAEHCEAYLRLHPDDADGLFLFGLVNDARGDSRLATGLYRKALYVDPRHVDALLQMAVMAERRGDGTQAQQLRRRAQAQQEAHHDR
jgi:chemotaxis protein methyltransferase WspC